MTAGPVALTPGEPAGIGPELVARAWAALRGECPFFWIGDPRWLPQGAVWREISRPENAVSVMPDALPVLRHEFKGSPMPGRPDPANATSVVEGIAQAVELTMSGEASAVCTCPISKKALKDGAGFAFPGHTEYLADLSGADRAVMMLVSGAMRVVPTTIHIPLAEVSAVLTAELLEYTIETCHRSLQREFAIKAPRIAVSGLNPHAGESGSIGEEDGRIIAPVIDRLADRGMAIDGPRPADSMFHDRARAGYDAAVTMYHDQALIPIKTLSFDSAVNVTLGLPFVRTSPDHGTAFDIAGRGMASPTSLIEAIRMAARMSRPGVPA